MSFNFTPVPKGNSGGVGYPAVYFHSGHRTVYINAEAMKLAAVAHRGQLPTRVMLGWDPDNKAVQFSFNSAENAKSQGNFTLSVDSSCGSAQFASSWLFQNIRSVLALKGPRVVAELEIGDIKPDEEPWFVARIGSAEAKG